MSEKRTVVVERAEQLWEASSRRGFLKALGVGGAIVMMPGLFSACKSDNDSTGPGTGGPVTLDLSTDVGIVNYAYALEQLEAAFYSAVVVSAPFAGLSAELQEVFYDLRNHEVIHREFLRNALGANAIASLSLNAATVNATLTNRDVILRNAEAFEDLGVSAYNGAGKYLASADYLTLAGKIVSVEARHAAAIRDIRDALGVTGGDAAGTRFAGDSVVSPSTGLDVKLEPSSVLSRVAATSLVSSAITIGAAPSKPASSDAGPPSPTP